MAEEHKTVIRIAAEVKGAIAGLKSVQAAVATVRSAVVSMMSAFGIVALAVTIANSLAEAYKKVTDFINRAAVAAGKLRFANTIREAAECLDVLIRKQQNYNRLLRDELDSLEKAGELRELQKSGDDYVESKRREFDRARELAGTTDERAKLEMQQRWKKEDERREIDTRISSTGNRISEEDEKSSIYRSKADAAKGAAAKAEAEGERLSFDLNRAVSDEQRKQIEEKIKALGKEREANLRNAETYEKEAKQAEERLKILEEERRRLEEIRDEASKSPADAAQRMAENNIEIDREKKKAYEARERARTAKDPSESAKEEEKADKADSRVARLEEKNREIAKSMTKTDIDIANELTEFERKRREDADVSFEEKQRKSREKSDAAAEFAENAAEEDDRRRKKAADEYGGYADRLIDTAGGSGGNRLTAMGLGDGASGNAVGAISTDVKELVTLFRQNVEATRNLRFGAGGAVLGE